MHETLTGAGFEHYEVSNFALPGFRARHNAAYWHGVKYLASVPQPIRSTAGNAIGTSPR